MDAPPLLSAEAIEALLADTISFEEALDQIDELVEEVVDIGSAAPGALGLVTLPFSAAIGLGRMGRRLGVAAGQGAIVGATRLLALIGPRARAFAEFIYRQMWFADPEVMRLLPDWQRDVADLQERLARWQQRVFPLLRRLNIELAGPGFSAGVPGRGYGYRRDIAGLLAAGRAGGRAPVWEELKEILASMSETIEGIATEAGDRLWGSPRARAVAPEGGISFDELVAQTLGRAGTLRHMDEVTTYIAQSGKALAAAVTAGSDLSDEQFAQLRDAVLRDMDSLAEQMDTVLLAVQSMLEGLTEAVPEQAGRIPFPVGYGKGSLTRIGRSAERRALARRGEIGRSVTAR